jgi:hypothetical protein
MIVFVPRRAAVTAAILSLGLSGCVSLQTDVTSAEDMSLAATQVAQEVDFDDQDDPDSYFREFAPWKAAARRVVAPAETKRSSQPSEVRVASAPRGIVDAGTAPELFPEDPEELKRWLELRSERAADAHRTHLDRLRTMEQRSASAVNGICSGC